MSGDYERIERMNVSYHQYLSRMESSELSKFAVRLARKSQAPHVFDFQRTEYSLPWWGDYVQPTSPSIMIARGSAWLQYRADDMIETLPDDPLALAIPSAEEDHVAAVDEDERAPNRVDTLMPHGRDLTPTVRSSYRIGPETASRLYPLISPWSLYQLSCSPHARDAAPSLQDFTYQCPFSGQRSLKNIIDAQFDRWLKASVKPDAHQWETLQYCLTGDDTYIADDAGLGKTLSVIMYMILMRPMRVLIIAPSSAKYNWADEIDAFWPNNRYAVNVIDSGAAHASIGLALRGTAAGPGTITIINYDILDQAMPFIHDLNFDLLVCDEAKRLQYEESARTCRVLGGTPGKAQWVDGKKQSYKAISALKRIFCDGTPMDKPFQLWPVFKAFDRTGIGADKVEFAKKYCGAFFDPFGKLVFPSKIDKEPIRALGQAAKKRFMIRHSDEVLGLQKPTESVTFITLPEDDLSRMQSDEQNAILAALADLDVKNPDAAKAIRAQIMDEDTQQRKAAVNNPNAAVLEVVGNTLAEQLTSVGARGPAAAVVMERMATVRRELGELKAPLAAQVLFEHWLKNDYEPIIVFAYHKDVVAKIDNELGRLIYDYLTGPISSAEKVKLKAALPFYNAMTTQLTATITGATSAARKRDIRNDFQKGHHAFLIANIQAAGEALTLTRARDVFFVEIDWSARAIRQAWKRAHRRGQEKAVRIFMFFVDRTFDYTLASKFLAKRSWQDAFFDEEEDDG